MRADAPRPGAAAASRYGRPEMSPVTVARGAVRPAPANPRPQPQRQAKKKSSGALCVVALTVFQCVMQPICVAARIVNPILEYLLFAAGHR